MIKYEKKTKKYEKIIDFRINSDYNNTCKVDKGFTNLGKEKRFLKRTDKKNQDKQQRKEDIKFYIQVGTFIILIIDKILSWF